jgi:hypothetical protein
VKDFQEAQGLLLAKYTDLLGKNQRSPGEKLLPRGIARILEKLPFIAKNAIIKPHMTHKHSTLSLSFIRASTAAFLLMGIANTVGYHGQAYLSSLSGGGATLTDVSAADTAAAFLVTPLHASAPVEPATTEVQLMLGILFILAGFSFHALYLMRKEQLFHKNHPLLASMRDLKKKFWSHLDKAVN